MHLYIHVRVSACRAFVSVLALAPYLGMLEHGCVDMGVAI